MRTLLFAVIILLASCFNGGRHREATTYCGTVIGKGKEEPTSGYKRSTEAKYFIVMHVDSCNQTIRVNVTVPTYYSKEIGSNVCFDLDGWDLYGGGNTTSPDDTLKCN